MAAHAVQGQQLMDGLGGGAAATSAWEELQVELEEPQQSQEDGATDAAAAEEPAAQPQPAEPPLGGKLGSTQQLDEDSLPSYALADGQPAAVARPPAAAAGRTVSSGTTKEAGGPVEVFIGGLPANAADFDVFLALADAGEVLSVKLFRRGRDKGECRGYGLATMASQEDADRAVAEVTQACGCRVAVSIPTDADVAQRDAAVRKGPVQLRRRGVPTQPACSEQEQQGGSEAGAAGESEPAGQAAEGQAEGREGVVPPPVPPEGSMARLLRRVREHGDDMATLASAAYATLFAVPGRPRLAFPPSRRDPRAAAAAAAHGAAQQAPLPAAAQLAAAEERAAAERPAPAQPAEAPQDAAAAPPLPKEPPGPEAGSYLDAFPRCKALMDKLRASKATAARTPLQAVHDYASRLMLVVLYDERADSPLGPFSVKAKLTGQRGQHTFAVGSGRANSKQLAKQMAGASLLESLLATVPEADFMVAKRPKAQPANPQSGPGAGRGGRGGGRAGPAFGGGGERMPRPGVGPGFGFQPVVQQQQGMGVVQQMGGGYLPGAQYGQQQQQPSFRGTEAQRVQQEPYGYYSSQQPSLPPAAVAYSGVGGYAGAAGGPAAAGPRAGYGGTASDPGAAARAGGYSGAYGSSGTMQAAPQQSPQHQAYAAAQVGSSAVPYAQQSQQQAQQPQQQQQQQAQQQLQHAQPAGPYSAVYQSGGQQAWSRPQEGAQQPSPLQPQRAQHPQQDGHKQQQEAAGAGAAANVARRYISNTPASAPQAAAGYGSSAAAPQAAGYGSSPPWTGGGSTAQQYSAPAAAAGQPATSSAAPTPAPYQQQPQQQQQYQAQYGGAASSQPATAPSRGVDYSSYAGSSGYAYPPGSSYPPPPQPQGYAAPGAAGGYGGSEPFNPAYPSGNASYGASAGQYGGSGAGGAAGAYPPQPAASGQYPQQGGGGGYYQSY